MKKRLLFFLLILFAVNSYSQETIHLISTGYGFSSTINNTKKLDDMLAASLKTVDFFKEQYSTGISYVSYKYALETSYVSLGATYAFEMKNGNIFTSAENSEGGIIKNFLGNYTKSFHTVAAEVKYDYYRKKLFGLYAIGGFGITFQKEKYTPEQSLNSEVGNNTFFNLQLTPLGIKYGEQFVVFGEIGFGYKGLLNIGFAVGF